MADKKLSTLIKKTLASRDPKTKNAVLGNYAEVVLTGKPYQVYARVGGVVMKIRNDIAPNTPNLRVVIGKVDGQSYWQVISFRDAYTEPTVPNIPDHNDVHRYLPIYRDQIVNLNGYPVAGALSVQVMGADVVVDNIWITVPSTLFDLTASLPTAGARWVLFQFHKTTGVITTVNGSLVDSKELLKNTDIPAPSTNNIPFLAVRMYDNQVEFSYTKDFARPFHIIGSGGGGASYLDDLLDVEIDYPTDGQVLTYDAYSEMWVNADSAVVNPPATTAANDVQVGNGSGNWIKATIAAFITTLRTTLDTIYKPIASGAYVFYDNVLASAAASFDITSIPAGYSYLRLTYYLRQSSTTVDCPMIFNNDSGANYNFLKVVIASGGVTPTDFFAQNNVLIANAISTDTTSDFSSGEITIQAYADAVGFKNFQVMSSRPINATAGLQRLYNYHGLWKSTSPITRITIPTGAGNFIIGSRVTVTLFK